MSVRSSTYPGSRGGDPDRVLEERVDLRLGEALAPEENVVVVHAGEVLLEHLLRGGRLHVEADTHRHDACHVAGLQRKQQMRTSDDNIRKVYGSHARGRQQDMRA